MVTIEAYQRLLAAAAWQCGCTEYRTCDECQAVIAADDRFAWEFDRFMEMPTAAEVASWDA